MTGTAELAVREDAQLPELRLPALPGLPDTDSWIRAMLSISKLADQICDTSFVPKAYRGDPAAVTAAILTGRELGLPPMTALRHVQVVEGVPSLDAEYKRARVLAAGHEFDILEWDNEHCKVSARRRGSRKPPLEVEYTIKDARLAGLVRDRSKYVTAPRVMMLARATTLVCNAIFSDVTNGLATTELLDAGDADAIADAAGAALPLPTAPDRPRVTAEQARARARHADAVTGEVITTEPDGNAPPPADDATPAEPPTPEPDTVAGDPRDDVLGHLERLAVTGPDIGAYLTRFAGKKLASVESLNRQQAEWFTDRLSKLTTRDELEAAAVAAEAKREEATNAGE